jgi:hypothetical protein
MSESHEARDWEMLYSATLQAMSRARSTLIVIITISCIGFFHFYMWYCAWSLARLAGREEALSRLESIHQQHRYLIDKDHDDHLAATWKSDIEIIRTKRRGASPKIPVVDLSVDDDDFSVALAISGVAALLWLIFNQSRLNHNLQKVNQSEGWATTRTLLDLHFSLIGSHATPIMRRVGKMLTLILPALSLLFFLSDLYGFAEAWHSTSQYLFFQSTEYVARVLLRLGTGLGHTILLWVLGSRSFKEWKTTEDQLLQFET